MTVREVTKINIHKRQRLMSLM